MTFCRRAHAFLGEESFDGAYHLTDAPTWVCDPVDGTAFFFFNTGNPGVE
jgi:fructose-1,6-bisphosphatase/inositol monophosphatase family enzyme